MFGAEKRTQNTEEATFSKLKLSLDERAHNLSARLRDYRSKHFPWSTPAELDTLFDRFGTYIHEGPGMQGTNAPIKWLEEHTHGDDMVAADRRTILQKSETERNSVLGRLERAQTNEELATIIKTLDEIETVLSRLEVEVPGEYT